MKNLFLKLSLLIAIVFTSSCTKDDIFIDIEDPIEEGITPPLTYKLYKESYYNQKSGIVFRWGDYRPNDEISHSTKMGTSGGYFAGGHSYHDVNNDGYQDILVTYHLNSEISSTDWYINSGDNEHFNKTNLINTSTNNLSSHKILKTDVNNDNLADFILLGVDEREPGNYGGNFTTLLQKPNGTFDLISIDDGKGLWYHNGAAGDLNGDGFIDVVTATYIWYGDGNGHFTNSEITIHDYISPALTYEIVDFNKDGFNDIIVGTNEGKTTSGIILGKSNGFDSTNQVIYLPKTNAPSTLDFELMDVDNDGDLDILELKEIGVENDEWATTSWIHVYINNNMSFTYEPNLFPESKDGGWINGDKDKHGWASFKIDDIDGDGIDDIVCENYSDGDYNGLKKINGIWKKYTFKFGN